MHVAFFFGMKISTVYPVNHNPKIHSFRSTGYLQVLIIKLNCLEYILPIMKPALIDDFKAFLEVELLTYLNNL